MNDDIIKNRRNIRFQWLFYALILLLLFPLFRLNHLFTHDGPAHIFNACLIREIVFGNPLASDFLHLKFFPEPNWTGHFFLASISALFPPAISEKIFLGTYIIFFPLFFRNLLNKINPASGVLSLLVLPFVYSYFFFGGLYNFLAGLTMFFAAMSIVLPMMEMKGNKKYLRIFIFSILLYFSHLVALCVFILMIFLASIYCYRSENSIGGEKGIAGFIKTSFPLILSLLPSLILLFVFFSDKLFLPSAHSSVSLIVMLESLYFISPIITLQYEPENLYSLVIFLLFLILIVAWLIRKKKNHEEKNTRSISFYQRSSYWLTACILMLLFFFFIPDQAASGGVIKFRFALFFFLFLIILLSTKSFGSKIKTLIPVIISGWMILKFIYFFPLMKNLDEDAKAAMRITDHIKENSILLPLNYSSNWMHCNLFNYAGTVKNIFVLDNYEAGMPHFPLEWKSGRNPVTIMGNFNIDPPPLCADVNAFEKQTNHNIDYIVVWKYLPLSDSCTLKIQSMLASGYHLIYSEKDDLKLYQRN